MEKQIILFEEIFLRLGLPLQDLGINNIWKESCSC